MKKEVKVKAIKIENFRGIKALELDFSKRSRIQGKNGSGKSSIYNSYLWCLFGKDSEGKSMEVQPLTLDNKIVHKVTTSVEIIFDIDGIETVVKRTQKENWSVPRGTDKEVFNGNVQERYFNEVPCSVKEFAEKLNGICNVDDWFMLSSISAFMGIKQEDRRKKLTEMAGDIDESRLMLDYPEIAKELSNGKSLEELLRQTKTSYKKAKMELDEIPSRIDQQEKLRVVDVDFDSIEKKNVDIEKEISLIDSKLANNVDVVGEEIKKLLSEKNEYLQQLSDIETSLKKERLRKIEVFESQIQDANFAKIKAEQKKKFETDKVALCNKEISDIADKISLLKEQWIAENESVYVSDFSTECPTCGTPFDSYKIKEMRDESVRRFNSNKINNLKEIEDKVVELKGRRSLLKNDLIESENQIISLSNCIEEKEKEIKEISVSLAKIPSVELALASSIEKPKIEEKLRLVEAKIKELSNVNVDTGKEELLEKKKSLVQDLKSNVAILQGKAVNERIDDLLQELNTQSKNLSQAVASLDKIVFDIQSYKKRKISLVEEKVSSLFNRVTWKLYEPNISNDGEKEICQALIDGKPYEQQNTATKVNAGIDIINGFSKALAISLPLFVDNKESVSQIIETEAQLITLEVVEDMDLCITNY